MMQLSIHKMQHNLRHPPAIFRLHVLNLKMRASPTARLPHDSGPSTPLVYHNALIFHVNSLLFFLVCSSRYFHLISYSLCLVYSCSHLVYNCLPMPVTDVASSIMVLQLNGLIFFSDCLYLV